MTKQLKIWLTFALAAFMLAACSDQEAEPTNKDNDSSSAQTEQTTFPLTTKDALGNEITLEKDPTKIVSLVPSNTEILFALNEGDQVVGVSDFDNYPEEALTKEKIGGQEFNVEKIISLQPDLVLAHEANVGVGDAGLQQLRDAGIAVYVIPNANDVDTVYETIQTIGQLTDETDVASKTIAEMKEKIAAIQEKVKSVETPKTVLVEVSPEPEIFAVANGTFMNEMLSMINAKNVLEDQEGWIKMSAEEIIKRNPDVILTTYGDYVENPEDQVKNRPGFNVVTAVKNNAVTNVNADTTSRPTPRIVDALDEMAKAIYTDAFKE